MKIAASDRMVSSPSGATGAGSSCETLVPASLVRSWAAVNRSKAVDALIKHTPVKSPAIYDQLALTALDGDGKMDLASFDQQQDFFLASGALRRRAPSVGPPGRAG